MDIKPGDIIRCESGGQEFFMQAVSTPDGGRSWLCTREDRPANQTAIILSEDELLSMISDCMQSAHSTS